MKTYVHIIYLVFLDLDLVVLTWTALRSDISKVYILLSHAQIWIATYTDAGVDTSDSGDTFVAADDTGADTDMDVTPIWSDGRL